MKDRGTLTVTKTGIVVETMEGSASTRAGGPRDPVTVEDLMRSAEYMARAMRLPYADPVMEAMRIHREEQNDACIRDVVSAAIDKLKDES